MHFGVITTSYPRYGGDPAGSFVHGFNRYLRRLGHRVSVVCAGDAGAPIFERLDDVSVHRLESSLFYAGGAPDALATGLASSPFQTISQAGRFSVGLVRATRRLLADCDALISHWLLPCGLLAAQLQHGRPHIAIAHSSDVHLLRRLRLAWLGRLIGRHADLVYTAEHLMLPGVPGRVVPMGIDLHEFSTSEPERAAARQQFGLQVPTLLFLGRLVPVKGLGVLLAALSQVVRQHAVELIVAGDGPLKVELSEQARRDGLPVRFVGEVSGSAKRQLLAAADLLVLPSLELADGRTEGAPVVIWEALASRLPIVASRVGGIAVQLGDAGLTVPAGHPQALADAISRLLGDADLSARLRQLGPGRAAQADWAQVAAKILRPQWLSGSAASVALESAAVITNQHPNCYRERYK